MGKFSLSETKQSLKERFDSKKIRVSPPTAEDLVKDKIEQTIISFLSEFGITYPLDFILPPPGVHKVYRQGTICVLPCSDISSPLTVTDAYVASDTPTINYGTTNPIIARTSGSDGIIKRILIQPSAIPSAIGDYIQSCILRITGNPIASDGATAGVLNIKRISSAWDPATVTYATSPSIAPVPVAQVLIPSGIPFSTDTTFDVNITALARLWSDGTYPNYGICIEVDSATLTPITGTITFSAHSIEDVSSALKPSFSFLYTPIPGTVFCESSTDQLTFKARSSGPLVISKLDFIFEDPYAAPSVSITYRFDDVENSVNYQSLASDNEPGHWKFGRVILERDQKLTVKFKNSSVVRCCIGFEAELWQL